MSDSVWSHLRTARRLSFRAIAVILLPATILLSASIVAADEGLLFIVGGGGTPDAVVGLAVRSAGGPTARVVILPQASTREERGRSSLEMFRDRQVLSTQIVELDDPEAARKAIRNADLIWFPGGQQSLLMEELRSAGVDEEIRSRHRAGTVIGGTSAGAAVMSTDMIPRMPEEQALRAKNTPVMPGLGLAPDLMVDQHFVRRSRMNRLLSAVVDNPGRIGIGIGERTAIVVQNHHFRVLGEGSVVVIDSRKAAITAVKAAELQQARHLQVHILRSGDEFQW